MRILRLKTEPKCPECGVGIDRPKCMWELGAACPRHEVRRELERLAGGARRASELLKQLRDGK